MAIGKVGAVGGTGAASALERPGRAGFSQVMEGSKGAARPPGIPVATEGAPSRVPVQRPEAARGVCETGGVERVSGGRSEVKAAGQVGAVPKPGEAQAARVLDRVGEAQRRLDHILELAESGRSFSAAELLAFQAHVYRASQELDLAGKVVEKATGGVKQILQTQV
ncbi:ATP-dependent helicase HrpB [Cystobacter ferrugineus]|uniref:ATP-dependent helicase HrpB n=1 Tax=Cystobacter ferrugineus TaxID=83449 RepID=A0A1L9AW62_9BACT|nr:ATP-dependent helicase HrpB [Cystobacter ferrugineus]OJH34250.1 ATP-dependent helicase HrpB [Cystobacter ferrugineus]